MDYTMPMIDLDKLRPVLEDEEFAIVRRIIAKQGKNKGRLRASKPHVDIKADPLSGKAAYVWRMVAFSISPIGQHQCMPVTADWDLPVASPDVYDNLSIAAKSTERRLMAMEMDKLADKVINTVPRSEWHGTKRWAYALGYADRPQGEV